MHAPVQLSLQGLLPNVPIYPRINTSKITMPCKDDADRTNTRVSVSLGSDLANFASETHRSYTAPTHARGNTLSLQEMVKQSTDISDAMLKMSRKSNVFRSGDYNDMSK